MDIDVLLLEHLFQSTHPVRGATGRCHTFCVYLQFQSTHPVRGATGLALYLSRLLRISIHAPREGCDTQISPANVGH